MRSEGYGTWSVCLSVRRLANLAVQGTGRPMTTTNRFRVARSLGVFPETTAFERYGVKTANFRERRSSVQSIAQAPRGMFCRSMRAHNRETPRSSIVVSDRSVFLSAQFEFDLPKLYPNG